MLQQVDGAALSITPLTESTTSGASTSERKCRESEASTCRPPEWQLSMKLKTGPTSLNRTQPQTPSDTRALDKQHPSHKKQCSPLGHHNRQRLKHLFLELDPRHHLKRLLHSGAEQHGRRAVKQLIRRQHAPPPQSKPQALHYPTTREHDDIRSASIHTTTTTTTTTLRPYP